jgi:hypothetical protein
MNNLNPSHSDQYSEAEAAQMLGISIPRLHALLDEYVFNEGSSRPPCIEFTSSDILLLNYWLKTASAPKAGRVLQMPRKRK